MKFVVEDAIEVKLLKVRPEYIKKLTKIEKVGKFNSFKSIKELRTAIEVFA